MIIVDLNQVIISSLMASLGTHAPKLINKTEDEGTYENESLLRHFVLNSIRSYNHKFKDQYGELVIACDATDYWRKDIFPYYKQNRKKDRDASELDWNVLFKSLNKIRDEIITFLPYRVIRIDRAEADDVIASLCHEFGNTSQKIMIVSGDKDFKQLQSYMNVEQYDPVRKKKIVEKNPEAYLKEHIMRGDGGDGIPNFLSPDDKFVTGVRAKPISAKNINKWIYMKPAEFCDDHMLRGYKRNEALVDLQLIPENIKIATIESYNKQVDKHKQNNRMLTYFIEKRLKNLTEVITQFKVNHG